MKSPPSALDEVIFNFLFPTANKSPRLVWETRWVIRRELTTYFVEGRGDRSQDPEVHVHLKQGLKIQKPERARELMQMSESSSAASRQGNAPSEKGHPKAS